MLEHLIHFALLAMFILVTLESFGLPLPGETSLITCAVLASQGHYQISEVIIVAAAAAIVGDNLGYWLIGRVGGRDLLLKTKWLRKYSKHFMPRAEQLMARHGGKTVFFGRFIAFLRFTAAWVAGMTGMPWRKFLFFNAAGGICWAVAMGLLAYYLGSAAAVAVSKFGLLAAIFLVLIVVGYYFVMRFIDKKVAGKA